MKTALVCGAGGFIGGHLVIRLKREGYWVRGVDIKHHEFTQTVADEFLLLDLRDPRNCRQALTLPPGVPGDAQKSPRTSFDEVYQLAADMGGMGFIHAAECDIMHNSALINIHMIDTAARVGVPRYFFSSSACVYRDMMPGEPALTEDDAFPAMPDNEYGWEKLYAERMALAYAHNYPIQVRIARFQNCYGPEGTWRGGREKAPAAICRKVAMAEDGGTIPVWGDGSAIRGYTYVDDLIDGVYRLMHADPSGSQAWHSEPDSAPRPSVVPSEVKSSGYVANIGTDEYVSVAELVQTVIDVSGKRIRIEYVEGPVGVHARNFTHARMHAFGWRATTTLREGIAKTYKWVEEQVRRTAQSV